MILVDPDPAADATRGSVDNRLVEAIDLLPTFVDALGGDAMPHRLEGRSLLALTRGRAAEGWRDAVFAEADYAWRAARLELNVAPHDARAIMVRTDRWKYVHFENFRPQLFDLAEDPGELCDLGASDGHAAVRAELHERIFAWLRARRTRTTISDDEVVRRTNKSRKQGFIIGEW